MLPLMLLANEAWAQVKVGNNSTTLNANAVLEIESTNKGLLLPRLSLTSTTAVAPMSGTITAGMAVYNTNTSITGTTAYPILPGGGTGIYVHDGTGWTGVRTSISAYGQDVSGINNTMTVIGLQGRAVASTAPTTSQVLQWNGTNWAPATLAIPANQTLSLSGQTLTISGGNAVTLPIGSVTTGNGLALTAGVLSFTGNAAITANNGLTATGSTVALGGTLTQNTTINTSGNNLIMNGNIGHSLTVGDQISVTTPASVTADWNSTNAASLVDFRITASSTFPAGTVMMQISKPGLQGAWFGVNKSTASGSIPGNAVVLATGLTASGLVLGRNLNLGAPTSDFYIEPTNGFVGIGLDAATFTPSANLHVSGTVRLQGLPTSATNTTVVTTDVNGNLASTPIATLAPAQTLTASGANLTISRGNTVTLPIAVTTVTTGNGLALAAGVLSFTGNAAITATNGLTATGSTVALGGTLTQSTTIAQGTNTLLLTGANSGTAITPILNLRRTANNASPAALLIDSPTNAPTENYGMLFRNGSAGAFFGYVGNSPGISAVEPGGPAIIAGALKDINFFTSPGPDQGDASNPTDPNNIVRMTIRHTSGNVGIGSNQPSARLHTVGTVRLEGLPVDNTNTTVLSVDASGNVSTSDLNLINNKLNIRSLSASASVIDADNTILVNTTAAGLTLTLPLASASSGRVLTIRKVDESSNAVTFVNGPIRNSTTSTFTTLNYLKTIQIQSDGTQWYVINN
ncbi:beta strand repeat-containing protein [Spirosoma utsteinense]|uniref:Uncharacterized protein n=2 Tax=Spirosoma utsteinense TaxID=2585773 RepID=A0ABR6WFG7_9BACT|nr:hypothetical protein [Spirosoma utsteinense]MBC3789128.1 hypothetical protein [Spirosoma utsteinense]MBC3795276.1 hypothetical protein [Spirosoma utsteinense]